jgi:hypothetical protein
MVFIYAPSPVLVAWKRNTSETGAFATVVIGMKLLIISILRRTASKATHYKQLPLLLLLYLNHQMTHSARCPAYARLARIRVCPCTSISHGTVILYCKSECLKAKASTSLESSPVLKDVFRILRGRFLSANRENSLIAWGHILVE